MTVSPKSTHTNGGETTFTVSRWRVLAALSAMYASFGFVIATTASLVTPIRDDLGLGNSQMGLVLGAWQLSYIAMSIPASRAIDRYGPRRSLTAAGIVIVLSALGRALAIGFPSLLVGAAVLGVGSPLVSVGAPAVTASLFEGGTAGGLLPSTAPLRPQARCWVFFCLGRFCYRCSMTVGEPCSLYLPQ